MSTDKKVFKPAWWLRSPHLQTMWPVFFKRKHILDLQYEQFELEDGDFLDLCWSKKQSDKIVLLLHGLEGSIHSHYINGIFYRLEQAGYRPVLMHFRGCSGRMNRCPGRTILVRPQIWRRQLNTLKMLLIVTLMLPSVIH